MLNRLPDGSLYLTSQQCELFDVEVPDNLVWPADLDVDAAWDRVQGTLTHAGPDNSALERLHSQLMVERFLPVAVAALQQEPGIPQRPARDPQRPWWSQR